MDATPYEPLGDLLRRHRRAAGFTQEELAERAGVSDDTVSNIERGQRHVPRKDTLRLLAEALGLAREDTATLLARAGHARRPSTASAPPQVNPPVSRLPISPYPLIGREQELHQLTQRLRRRKGGLLLTLSGPAGVGKTRLGLAAAHLVQEDFRDGALFVSLAALDDPSQLARVILQSLRAQDDDTRAVDEAFIAALRDKHMLLLLDNFEHLAQGAVLLAHLLEASPSLTVLATSRAALRVRGEQEVVVSPLALPRPEDTASPDLLVQVASVALLVQQAQTLVPDFQVTTANAPAVAELCHRLDGLPLALELVAGRLRLFSSQALLDRLGDRIALVAGGPVDMPQRQQSLHAALAWSYDLLSPAAQRLLRWLSVFRDGCTLVAAEAVGSSALDEAEGPAQATVAELVEVLLEQHVIFAVPDDNPRIGMLHTIQAFAREALLASGEQSDAERAHAAYYLTLAEQATQQLSGPEQSQWLECLGGERANWEAALAWAIEARNADWGLRLVAALGPYWYVRGETREGRAWLERMLCLAEEHAGDAGDAVTLTPYRMRALHEAAKLAYRQGDYDQARAWLEASAALARESGDQRGLINALNGLGNVAINQGDFTCAYTLYAEGLRLARSEGNATRVANLLNNLASVAHEQGKYEEACSYYEESARLLRAGSHSRNLAAVLVNLSEVVCEQGEYARAMDLCRESLSLRQTLHDRWGIAFVQSKMADIFCAEGRYADASSLCEESLEQMKREGDRRGIADVLTCQGRIAQAQGAHARAAACHERSLSLQMELGIAHGAGMSHAHVGHAARDLGDWQRATRHYRQALGGYRKLGVQRGLAPVLEGIALFACLRCQPRRAAWLMERAERLRATLGISPTTYERFVCERVRTLIGSVRTRSDARS